MKKVLLIVALFSFSFPVLHAQFTIQGIVKKKSLSHETGDTINVFGSRVAPGSGNTQYLVEDNYTPSFVSAKRIMLLDTEVDYWDKVWFIHRGVDAKQPKISSEKRQFLKAGALEYYAQAKGNNIIYEDEILYDYLYQLILKIHPKKLRAVGTKNLGLIILKSHQTDYFVFDNGYIILTTGLLAQTKSEEELISILSNCIAHIVLEHNLINYNELIKKEERAQAWATFATVASSVAMIRSNYRNSTSYSLGDALDIGLAVHFLSTRIQESAGAVYTQTQQGEAISISTKFRNQFEHEALPNETFINKIAGTISYAAWQEFNIMNYNYAIDLLNRVKVLDLMTARDYLLLTKSYRLSINTEKSNQEALSFIKKGKRIDSSNLIDLDKEAGLLHLRLNDNQKAKEAFLLYKNGLLDLDKQGEDVSFDLEAINQILYNNRMLD